LDIIEKKVDREADLSKSKDHRSHTKKEEYRSAGRNHHHSTRHSVRREKFIPSLSHVRKHKRSFGVDEIQGDMRKIKPPSFNGEKKKDEDVKAWILGMGKYFQLHNYSSQVEGRIEIY
jgi:hypothetical protein